MYDLDDDAVIAFEQAQMEILHAVYDCIEHATVDSEKRRILWTDGDAVSIQDTVNKIHELSGLEKADIEKTVCAWLEVSAMPPIDLDEEQMERFEAEVETWISDYWEHCPDSSSTD